MKRLVFCFDGTWNRLDAPHPTNVVITAQSVTPVAAGGVVQIVHYDPGVGTTRREKWSGGLFGKGLLANIVDAYTFLVFNYEVGDEIYVFGFSRGAFTARSFIGLLRNCGILRRRDAGKITEAVKRYHARKAGEDHDSDAFMRFRSQASPDVCVDPVEDAWRVANVAGYRTGDAPVFRIRYVGVWDTVGSLGLPDYLLIARIFNRKTLYHDPDLSSMVVAARHAVSIDEQRRSFAPTLWANVEALNGHLGFSVEDEKAPYQQKWFPGDHGSVGGGGDVRGLSDWALDWIVSGARDVGLALDKGDSPIFDLRPDPLAPLVNTAAPKGVDVMTLLMRGMPRKPRTPGPQRVFDVAPTASRRWRARAEDLPERSTYRPIVLAAVARWLDEAPDVPSGAGARPLADPATGGVEKGFYTVRKGDVLTTIAERFYGHADGYVRIMEGNASTVLDKDRIYVGQVLRMPPAVGTVAAT